jgi:hypothetical protein
VRPRVFSISSLYAYRFPFFSYQLQSRVLCLHPWGKDTQLSQHAQVVRVLPGFDDLALNEELLHATIETIALRKGFTAYRTFSLFFRGLRTQLP